MRAINWSARIAILFASAATGACGSEADPQGAIDNLLGAGGSFTAVGGGASVAGNGNGGYVPVTNDGAGGWVPPPVGKGGSPVVVGGGNGGSTVIVGGGSGGSGAGGGDGAGGGAGASNTGGGGGVITGGKCCDDGNCVCHGPDPTALTTNNGPYKTATFTMSTGTVYYPTDAEPPLAGLSICPGFLNTGPEMAPWGPFYASWGIVCVVTNTLGGDLPNVRGDKLVAAIEELKKEQTKSGSPLNGKLAGRYGTSGYSMGGGGTTFASEKDPTLLSSVGLAAWGPDGPTVKTPTLFLCSDADTVASCTGTNSSYAAIDNGVPKMIVDIPGASHFNWFGPKDAGGGVSGQYALAFNKVFLEGDTRWKKLLLSKPSSGTMTTNIK